MRCADFFDIWQKGIIAWIHRKWNLFMPSFPLSACPQTVPRNILTFSNMNIFKADRRIGDWTVHCLCRMVTSITSVFFSFLEVDSSLRSRAHQLASTSETLWYQIFQSMSPAEGCFSLKPWHLRSRKICWFEFLLTCFHVWSYSLEILKRCCVSSNSWTFLLLLIDITPLGGSTIANIGQLSTIAAPKVHSWIQSGFGKFPTCALWENYCCQFLVLQHLLPKNVCLQHFPRNRIWLKSLVWVGQG